VSSSKKKSDQARITLALQRLVRSRNQRNLGNRAIDLAIALEVLFMSTERDEHSYKISLRLAKLLGGVLSAMRSAFGETQGLYDMRSAMVHSGRAKDGWAVDGMPRSAHELVDATDTRCALAIRKFLALGHIPESWTELELSSEHFSSGIGGANLSTNPTKEMVMNSKRSVDIEDHRLELLMSYTVFHIGLYMSLIAAVIATEKGLNLFPHVAIVVAVVCFLVAGACGGIIAVNVAKFDTPQQEISVFFQRTYGLRLWDHPLRGGGTSAARRASRSSGSSTMCVVPSRYGVFRL
jgi:hypothetical protein